MNKKPGKKRWVWLVVLAFLVINLPSLKNMWVLHQQIDELKVQENTIKVQNQKLKMAAERLKDNREVERIAREQLGLIKPGEHLLVPVVNSRP